MVARKKTLLDEGKVDKQCAWKEVGQQCQNDGHLSQAIHGAGPWYCRTHFAALMGWASWQAAVTDEPMSEVDKRVNRLVPRRGGESEHDRSMRCKAWTLNKLKNKLLREPGQDEEEAA